MPELIRSAIINISIFFLIFLKLGHNTLEHQAEPLPPLFRLDREHMLNNSLFHLLHRLSFTFIIKLYFLRDLVLPVVGLEAQAVQIKTEGRGQGHVELVVEECVAYELWLVFAYEYLYDAAYYLSYLMIHEALAFYCKFKPFFYFLVLFIIFFIYRLSNVQFLTFKLKNISSRFWVFCFQVFAIIVKIMSTNKFLTTLVYFFKNFLLIFFIFVLIMLHTIQILLLLHFLICLILFLDIHKKFHRAHITIYPSFNHLSDIKPCAYPPNSMHNNPFRLENFPYLSKQFHLFQHFIFLIEKFVIYCKQT